MYRTSKIFKVQSKGGSYKTKGKYYSFSRNDGIVIVFTTKKGKYGILELGKNWEMSPDVAKQFFKMIGFGVDPEKFDNVFKKPTFFNRKKRTHETINLYPAKATIIRMKVEQEIEDMKNDKGST